MQRFIIPLIFATGFSLSWMVIYAIELPDIGSSSDTIMSPLEEKKIGANFLRKLRQQVDIIDDEELSIYINNLGRKLAAYSDNPEQDFYFFIVKDSSINAFAVPGGYIGVHSGLILNSQDESELASVMAHEIAHVTQRHIARMLEASQKFSIPMVAAMIAAMIVGAKNPDVGQAAAASLMAGSTQLRLDYTRAHEYEADRVGIQMLAQAGFDPRSMPIFFERLQAANRYHATGVPEFLRTHPVTTERIAEARGRAEQFSVQKMPDSTAYHLMRARLLVVTEGNPLGLVKKLSQMLKEGRFRDERALRYGLALAYLDANQADKAYEQWQWLVKQDTDRVIYHLLKARILLIQEQSVEALKTLEQAWQLYPTDRLLVLQYADTLLRQQQAEKARSLLLDMPALGSARYYRLLAQAQQVRGYRGEAALALAENYYLSGQLKLALEQLKRAQLDESLEKPILLKITERYRELLQEMEEEAEKE